MNRANKGFSLAELLIVVAIIAILVAVAVPFLSVQLEKAKESADLSQIRIAIEEISKYTLDDYLVTSESVDDSYSKPILNNGELQMRVKATQTMEDWQLYDNKDKITIYDTEVEVPEPGENAYWLISLDEGELSYKIEAKNDIDG